MAARNNRNYVLLYFSPIAETEKNAFLSQYMSLPCGTGEQVEIDVGFAANCICSIPRLNYTQWPIPMCESTDSKTKPHWGELQIRIQRLVWNPYV